MASSTKEEVATQALARLGEPEITDFTADNPTAEKVNALYEDVILDLFAAYDWNWASVRVALSEDGGYSIANKWNKAYDLPALRTTRVGNPISVYNSTALRAPRVFDYELEDAHLLTNYDTVVIEYIARKDESLWPGYFVKMAVEALAAQFALPITENASKEEFHTIKAFGVPSENGEGGLFGRAMRADARYQPTRGLLDDADPMTEARFGGSRAGDGTW
jgi:hypothetical protein